ncbi:MAG: DNA-protecting protein DprA [Oscillospiraceae bacterium]|nr:DNA-protecting protein DprA [Oscillospiraceae bacterium]
MNGKERGFLLLTSHLGDPDRKPMTVAQFRQLTMRMAQMERPVEDRELSREDMLPLGYDADNADRILSLLADTAVLEHYLARGKRAGCQPVSRVSPQYPVALRKRLGLDAPGCLWAKGDLSLLDTLKIALVGSRDLALPNREFARRAGVEAARQGITLVSGNARGADRTAQEACLQAGGRVISVVADELAQQPPRENVLYLSEDGFDLPFTTQRALSRNRVIHALGSLTLVVQSDLGIGGTWDGTVKNLRNNWSPVFCFDDGGPVAAELEQLGATLILPEQLDDFSKLQWNIQRFL